MELKHVVKGVLLMVILTFNLFSPAIVALPVTPAMHNTAVDRPNEDPQATETYKPPTGTVAEENGDPPQVPAVPPVNPPKPPTTTTAKPSTGVYGTNHGYAMVCAGTREHTDYCQRLPRGYYCSSKGYLAQNSLANARYQPCEDQCECLNINPRPNCFLAWGDSTTRF